MAFSNHTKQRVWHIAEWIRWCHKPLRFNSHHWSCDVKKRLSKLLIPGCLFTQQLVIPGGTKIIWIVIGILKLLKTKQKKLNSAQRRWCSKVIVKSKTSYNVRTETIFNNKERNDFLKTYKIIEGTPCYMIYRASYGSFTLVSLSDVYQWSVWTKKCLFAEQ